MAISRPKPDILVESFEGYPIAVVEVKNLPNLSRDEATELRRSWIAHGLPFKVPYFLLLSQDVGFLWDSSQQESPDAPPAYEFPMEKVVARYSNGDSARRLYPLEFRLLVLQWLTNLATKPQKETEEPEKTLALSGFNESIKGSMALAEADL